MDLQRLTVHAAFPELIWVVVEQPPGERYRLDYDPATQRFTPTTSLSLFYDRGFSGAYGWVGGLGTPPGEHIDVILVTRRPLPAGSVVEVYPCGLFRRADGDHKLVALDAALHTSVEPPDLPLLPPADQAELRRLYPRIDTGEGWFNRDEALVLLRHGRGHAN